MAIFGGTILQNFIAEYNKWTSYMNNENIKRGTYCLWGGGGSIREIRLWLHTGAIIGYQISFNFWNLKGKRLIQYYNFIYNHWCWFDHRHVFRPWPGAIPQMPLMIMSPRARDHGKNKFTKSNVTFSIATYRPMCCSFKITQNTAFLAAPVRKFEARPYPKSLTFAFSRVFLCFSSHLSIRTPWTTAVKIVVFKVLVVLTQHISADVSTIIMYYAFKYLLQPTIVFYNDVIYSLQITALNILRRNGTTRIFAYKSSFAWESDNARHDFSINWG